jgi:hypothetical protein
MISVSELNPNTISVDLDVILAILTNTSEKSPIYQKAYNDLKEMVIERFNDSGYTNWDELDVFIEISQLKEKYESEC